jgi:curved DNA-binding protein CbpA
VRRYHPDHNGGDRSHEARLQKVIDAYQRLRKAPAFA